MEFREFTACSNLGGGEMFKYLVEYPNNVYKVVPSTEAKQRFPRMVIDYLEAKMDILFNVPLTYETHDHRSKLIFISAKRIFR